MRSRIRGEIRSLLCMQLKTIASFEASCSALSAYAGSYGISHKVETIPTQYNSPRGYGMRAFPLAPPTLMPCHCRRVARERRDAAIQEKLGRREFDVVRRWSIEKELTQREHG